MLLLRGRLRDENEQELLAKISICQQPLKLRCQTCNSVKEVRQRCKRKWCPFCKKQLAAARASEMEFMVERMRWPLFVTLTMRNVSQLSSADVRKLRRAFGKLRHRKLWKSRTRGGVAAVEITNVGNGWHPHLHAVIDCAWLAWKTPRPGPRSRPEVWKARCSEAAAELGDTWAKLLGQQTASVKVKRANKATIAKEVVKYTVKSEDLVLSEEPIGDMIRALDSTRLLTTFGQLHGQCAKNIRAQAKAWARARREAWFEENPREECCGDPDFMPEDVTITDPDRRLRKQGRLVCTSTF